MRLLYLCEREQGGAVHEYEFLSEGRFKFECAGKEPRLIVRRDGEFLPPDFFRGERNKPKSTVNAIGAIVGENAAGKTSVARFLQRIRAVPDAMDKGFDYLLVYEVESCAAKSDDARTRKWVIRWSWPGMTEPDLPDLPGVVWDRRQQNEKSFVNDFEFCYMSPHFSPEHPFLNNEDAMEDLSAYALMRKPVFDEYADSQGLEMSVANFVTAERRRAIHFINRFGTCKSVPVAVPNKMRIAPNYDFIADMMEWIGQIERETRTDEEYARARMKRSEDYFERHPRILEACERLRVIFRVMQSRAYRDSRDFASGAVICMMASVVKSRDWIRKGAIESDAFAEDMVSLAERVSARIEKGVGLKSLERRGLDDFLQSAFSRSAAGKDEQSVEIVKGMIRQCRDWMTECSHDPDDVEIFVRGNDALPAFFQSYDALRGNAEYLRIAFSPVLSSGEMSFLSLFGRLLEYFETLKKGRDRLKRRQKRTGHDEPNVRRLYASDVLLFLDEAETTLHPRLQRCLVDAVLWFVENCISGFNVHVIFASHSPILLSDIPKCNVVFLTKCDDAKETERRLAALSDLPNTFGANIYDLYKLSYFMDEGLDGTFARRKIDNMLAAVATAIREGHAVAPDVVRDLVGDRIMSNYFKGLRRAGLA